jgi:hypothetical protein
VRAIRTLRATWRRLETWHGRDASALPARQSSTLLMSGEGKRIAHATPRLSSTLPRRIQIDFASTHCAVGRLAGGEHNPRGP